MVHVRLFHFDAVGVTSFMILSALNILHNGIAGKLSWMAETKHREIIRDCGGGNDSMPSVFSRTATQTSTAAFNLLLHSKTTLSLSK
jgi:hypothetical protein